MASLPYYLIRAPGTSYTRISAVPRTGKKSQNFTKENSFVFSHFGNPNIHIKLLPPRGHFIFITNVFLQC